MDSNTKTLTREQAIQALLNGKRVTHNLFSYNEWMKLAYGETIVFEDGAHLTIREFFHCRNEKEWSDGFSIYGEANT